MYWNAHRCVSGAGEQLATEQGQSRDSHFHVTVILLACTILKIITKNVFSIYSTNIRSLSKLFQVAGNICYRNSYYYYYYYY